CSLSSALRRFTVLFGMGRSGSTALWSSGMTCCSVAYTEARARANSGEEIDSVLSEWCPGVAPGDAVVGDDRLGLAVEARQGCELHRTTLRLKHCLICKVIGSSLTGN